MATSIPLLLRVTGIAVTAAEMAGLTIKEVLASGDLKITFKGHNDPQTEADRAAQHCIVSSLTALHPKLRVIGEEGEDGELSDYKGRLATVPAPDVLKLDCPDALRNINEEELVVWVDPLDGTHDFTRGKLNSVTVLIGIARNGKPLAGVVHQPFVNGEKDRSRTFWGIVGIGHGGFTPNLLPDKSSINVVFSPSRQSANEEFRTLLTSLKSENAVGVGGIGTKTLMLIDGSANVMINPASYTMKWDSCAPEAVLRSLGGQLTDIHGKAYSYEENVSIPNANGILASIHSRHHDMCVKGFQDWSQTSK